MSDYTYQQGRPAPHHRLGITFEQPTTVEEGMRQAHLLDWDVRLGQQHTTVHDESIQPIPGKYATVRRNPYWPESGSEFETLGDGLTKSYQVVHNEVASRFAHDLLDVSEGSLLLDSAAEHRGGSHVMLSFKMPDNILVGGVDPVAPYLFMKWSHDGASALTTTFAAWRVACTNQIPSVLGSGMPVHKVRHVGAGVSGRLAEAQSMLGLSQRGFAELEAVASRWAEEQVTNDQFEEIIAQLLPETTSAHTNDRRLGERHSVRHIFEGGPNQEGVGQTAWGALNAWTEWTEWYAGAYSPDDRATAQLFSNTMENRRNAGVRAIERVVFA